MRSQLARIVAIVAIPLLLLIPLLIPRQTGHSFVVKTFFTNGMGLREGAKVRIAGVDLGTVSSIRVRPELKDAPVEVVMKLRPSYDLKIPSDSTVTLETAGVLGETYVAIDTTGTSGPPIEKNGTLNARKQNMHVPAEDLLNEVSRAVAKIDALTKQAADCEAKGNSLRNQSRPLPAHPSH